VLGLLVVGVVSAVTAAACPFCSATALTFSEELGTMDVAVIARLVKVPPPSSKPGEEVQKATFQVAQVIKGDGHVKLGEKFDTLYFGDGTAGKSFLVMGTEPPKIMWSTPLPLSDRAIKYLSEVLKTPKDGAQRLVFFQSYLEDADEIVARDAYDEFARAPYADLKTIKSHLRHDQIVSWIKNQDVPASRRRLYLVLLGLCGDEKDVPMIEEFIKSPDRKQRSGLDALIACYLTFKGDAGLPLIEELFLANQKADYADTYAAIMAIRFQGTDGGKVDRKRLLKALHLMLDRPDLADLVIPDLAKWEDWEVMDKLFALYKTANEKNSWVRVPVINYLRGCPLPKAKELLKECEKIDPESVRRANNFFPTGPAAPTPDKATKTVTPSSSEVAATIGEPVAPPSGATLAAVASGPPAPPADDGDQLAAALNQGVDVAEAVRKTPAAPANLWAILGVSWTVGFALFMVQWSVLRGAR
jgi:hypothetical protein